MPEYKDPSGRWRWRYTHRGRQYSGSTPKGSNTAKVARALEKEHFERIKLQQFTGVVAGDAPRFSELAAQVLAYHQAHVRPLSYESKESHFRVHLVPQLGKKRADEIGAKDVDDLVTLWKKAGAAPKTINTRLGTLARAFSLAIEWGVLRAAPRIKYVKEEKDVIRFLTEPEADALLAAARARRADHMHRWSSMVLIGLRTGLRVGELRGLQWADIDFQRGVLLVRRSDPGRRDMSAGPTKSGKARIIPLTPTALECLRAEHAYHVKKWEKVDPYSFVWPGIRDRTIARGDAACQKALASMLAKANIIDREGDRLGWHTLRHTYASWLAIRGVSLRVIQELLGHASIRQTEVYAKLLPNAVHHNAVATLDAAVIHQLDAGAPRELGPGQGDDDDGS